MPCSNSNGEKNPFRKLLDAMQAIEPLYRCLHFNDVVSMVLPLSPGFYYHARVGSVNSNNENTDAVQMYLLPPYGRSVGKLAELYDVTVSFNNKAQFLSYIYSNKTADVNI